MRKRNVFVLGALVLAVSVGLAGFAQASITSSTITGSTNPSKLPKTSRAATTLKVTVDTGYDATCVLGTNTTCSPYATNTTVKFDDDFTFTTKGLKACSPQEDTLAGPPAQAKAGPCKSAYVGSGSATLEGAVGPRTAEVTAFNGTPQAGKPRIILSTWVASLNTPAILIGKLSKVNAGDLGWQLDVNVPQIAGGSEVLTHFEVSVRKAFKVKVRKHHKTRTVKKNYIAARCHDGNRHMDYQETTTYSSGPQFSDTAFSTCTVKH